MAERAIPGESKAAAEEALKGTARVGSLEDTVDFSDPKSPSKADAAADLKRFERLCDEFERAYQAGHVPSLERFLGLCPPDMADRMLRALLPLDAEYRTDRGEIVGAAEYHRRFPQHPAAVEAAFRKSDVILAGVDETPGGPIRFAEYELRKVLGRGGMGVVHQAFHTKLKRLVAVKMLSKEQFDNPSSVARFEQEMAAIGRLSHPNIVVAYDAGEYSGTHYLAMEFVEGMNMAEVAERLGALPIADACEIARQAALALQYAHEHGLVHRDIKPSNLMLTPSGVVKLLDLGLARLKTEGGGEGAGLTLTGQVVGTLDYLAPEQADDCRRVDIRADIYSLAGTLYELLTTKLPVRTEHIPISRRFHALMNDAPTPIETFRPQVPKKLRAIIHRCLMRSPDDRFSTPGELAEALAKHATGCDLKRLHRDAERAPPIAKPAEPTKITPAPLGAPPPNTVAGSRRRPWLILAGLAATMAAIGYLVSLLANRS